MEPLSRYQPLKSGDHDPEKYNKNNAAKYAVSRLHDATRLESSIVTSITSIVLYFPVLRFQRTPVSTAFRC